MKLAMGILPAGRGSHNRRLTNRPRTVILKQAGERPHRLPSPLYPDTDLCLMSDELRVERSRHAASQATVAELRQQLRLATDSSGILLETSKRLAATIDANAALEAENAVLKENQTQASWWRGRYDVMRASLRELRSTVASATTNARELQKQNESLHKSLNVARERVDAQRTSGRELTQRISEWDNVIAALGKNLQEARGDCARRTKECEALNEKTTELQAELEAESEERTDASDRAVAAAKELKDARRKRMGRPPGHAGAEQLAARWPTMSKAARNQAFWRHCTDIETALVKAGIDDWNVAALARVLHWREMVPDIMSTKPFCLEKNSLVANLTDVLAAEYNVNLAMHVLSDVELSLGQYQKLRLAFCKTHSEKGWEKILWYQCPSSGKKFFMPEPLVSIHVMKREQQKKLQPHGLLLSNDGKVSQRSLYGTLRMMMDRDKSHLKDFTTERPAQPVWGIDHATISGARDFTHGGISLGAMYKPGSACTSELKMCTCVIGQYNDNTEGLLKMLGPKPAFKTEGGLDMPAAVGIGAELAQLCTEGELDGVPTRPKISVDFATLRGARAGRGKCAAVCCCKGQDQLHSYPGNGTIPDLPTGDTEDAYHAAAQLADEQCSWGSDLLCYPSLRSASHTPPIDWDFEAQGPWSCSWCERAGKPHVIWRSWAEFDADVSRLKQLKLAASDDRQVKSAYDNEMKRHSDAHGDQLLYQPPIIPGVDMDIYLIDPLHALLLNIPKTAWKYSFGDRMDADRRERVASYLTSIGCHLDIREKGKRDPQQKWFSGSQFDEFVLGAMVKRKSKSPGLIKNILAIIELVFDEVEVVSAAAAAEESEASKPAKKAKALSRKQRQQAGGAGGFGAEQAAAGVEQHDAAEALLDLEDLADSGEFAADSTAIKDYIRKRYGNHSTTVLNILKLWESYGKVYAAWRDPWDLDTDAYRAQRALRFARSARDFQRWLLAVSNYKHKSWYVHVCVWIVWRQLFREGNTYVMSTCMIESRGARIKRLGRRLTSWRPLCIGFTAYRYICRKTGELREGKRAYNSSPMHQLLQRLVLQEDSWHSSGRYNRPEKVRLQAALRTTLLKVEVDEVAPPANISSMTELLRKTKEA